MNVETIRVPALLSPHSPNPRIRKRVRKIMATTERMRRQAPDLVARIDKLHTEFERTLIFGTNSTPGTGALLEAMHEQKPGERWHQP